MGGCVGKRKKDDKSDSENGDEPPPTTTRKELPADSVAVGSVVLYKTDGRMAVVLGNEEGKLLLGTTAIQETDRRDCYPIELLEAEETEIEELDESNSSSSDLPLQGTLAWNKKTNTTSAIKSITIKSNNKDPSKAKALLTDGTETTTVSVKSIMIYKISQWSLIRNVNDDNVYSIMSISRTAEGSASILGSRIDSQGNLIVKLIEGFGGFIPLQQRVLSRIVEAPWKGIITLKTTTPTPSPLKYYSLTSIDGGGNATITAYNDSSIDGTQSEVCSISDLIIYTPLPMSTVLFDSGEENILSVGNFIKIVESNIGYQEALIACESGTDDHYDGIEITLVPLNQIRPPLESTTPILSKNTTIVLLRSCVPKDKNLPSSSDLYLLQVVFNEGTLIARHITDGSERELSISEVSVPRFFNQYVTPTESITYLRDDDITTLYLPLQVVDECFTCGVEGDVLEVVKHQFSEQPEAVSIPVSFIKPVISEVLCMLPQSSGFVYGFLKQLRTPELVEISIPADSCNAIAHYKSVTVVEQGKSIHCCSKLSGKIILIKTILLRIVKTDVSSNLHVDWNAITADGVEQDLDETLTEFTATISGIQAEITETFPIVTGSCGLSAEHFVVTVAGLDTRSRLTIASIPLNSISPLSQLPESESIFEIQFTVESTGENCRIKSIDPDSNLAVVIVASGEKEVSVSELIIQDGSNEKYVMVNEGCNLNYRLDISMCVVSLTSNAVVVFGVTDTDGIVSCSEINQSDIHLATADDKNMISQLYQYSDIDYDDVFVSISSFSNNCLQLNHIGSTHITDTNLSDSKLVLVSESVSCSSSDINFGYLISIAATTATVVNTSLSGQLQLHRCSTSSSDFTLSLLPKSQSLVGKSCSVNGSEGFICAIIENKEQADVMFVANEGNAELRRCYLSDIFIVTDGGYNNDNIQGQECIYEGNQVYVTGFNGDLVTIAYKSTDPRNDSILMTKEVPLSTLSGFGDVTKSIIGNKCTADGVEGFVLSVSNNEAKIAKIDSIGNMNVVSVPLSSIKLNNNSTILEQCTVGDSEGCVVHISETEATVCLVNSDGTLRMSTVPISTLNINTSSSTLQGQCCTVNGSRGYLIDISKSEATIGRINSDGSLKILKIPHSEITINSSPSTLLGRYFKTNDSEGYLISMSATEVTVGRLNSDGSFSVSNIPLNELRGMNDSFKSITGNKCLTMNSQEGFIIRLSADAVTVATITDGLLKAETVPISDVALLSDSNNMTGTLCEYDNTKHYITNISLNSLTIASIGENGFFMTKSVPLSSISLLKTDDTIIGKYCNKGFITSTNSTHATVVIGDVLKTSSVRLSEISLMESSGSLIGSQCLVDEKLSFVTSINDGDHVDVIVINDRGSYHKRSVNLNEISSVKIDTSLLGSEIVFNDNQKGYITSLNTNSAIVATFNSTNEMTLQKINYRSITNVNTNTSIVGMTITTKSNGVASVVGVLPSKMVRIVDSSNQEHNISVDDVISFLEITSFKIGDCVSSPLLPETGGLISSINGTVATVMCVHSVTSELYTRGVSISDLSLWNPVAADRCISMTLFINKNTASTCTIIRPTRDDRVLIYPTINSKDFKGSVSEIRITEIAAVQQSKTKTRLSSGSSIFVKSTRLVGTVLSLLDSDNALVAVCDEFGNVSNQQLHLSDLQHRPLISIGSFVHSEPNFGTARFGIVTELFHNHIPPKVRIIFSESTQHDYLSRNSLCELSDVKVLPLPTSNSQPFDDVSACVAIDGMSSLIRSVLLHTRATTTGIAVSTVGFFYNIKEQCLPVLRDVPEGTFISMSVAGTAVSKITSQGLDLSNIKVGDVVRLNNNKEVEVIQVPSENTLKVLVDGIPNSVSVSEIIEQIPVKVFKSGDNVKIKSTGVCGTVVSVVDASLTHSSPFITPSPKKYSNHTIPTSLSYIVASNSATDLQTFCVEYRDLVPDNGIVVGNTVFSTSLGVVGKVVDINSNHNIVSICYTSSGVLNVVSLPVSDLSEDLPSSHSSGFCQVSIPLMSGESHVVDVPSSCVPVVNSLASQMHAAHDVLYAVSPSQVIHPVESPSPNLSRLPTPPSVPYFGDDTSNYIDPGSEHYDSGLMTETPVWDRLSMLTTPSRLMTPS